MRFYQVEQGSAAWYGLRIGRPTASNFHKIVTPKGEPSRQAMKYLYRLVAERLLNETMDDQLAYVDWVQRGREQEPNAVAAFEFINDVTLEPGGFATTDDGRLGASPDRIIRGRGVAGVEVKCPAPWTQIGYLLDGVEDDYRPQVQGQMLVCDVFEAVHFYSWHPQTPPFHIVTRPERGYQSILRSALMAFSDAVDIATERARSIGAYAVVRRVETPADVAYQADEDAQLKIIDPEAKDGAA